MIRITDRDGHKHLVARNNIARMTEAGSSSQWHGVRTVVRLFDGDVIEAAESMQDIAAQIAADATSETTR